MKTPLEELTSISLILLSTAHRNKNQHRLLKWWKQLSILRRNVDKLIRDIEKLERDEKFAAGGKSKWVVASREAVEARVEFVLRWVVPKCYL